MASSDIVSPSGLDLSPKPPSPVRVSKRAGFVFFIAGAGVLGLILYGVVTRGDRQLKLGFQIDETKGLTAATDAGKMIASKVPASPLAQGRDAAKEEIVTAAVAAPPTPPAQPTGRVYGNRLPTFHLPPSSRSIARQLRRNAAANSPINANWKRSTRPRRANPFPPASRRARLLPGRHHKVTSRN